MRAIERPSAAVRTRVCPGITLRTATAAATAAPHPYLSAGRWRDGRPRNVCPTYDEHGVGRPEMEKYSFIIFAVGIFSPRRRVMRSNA